MRITIRKPKLPKVFRNFYSASLLLFLCWMSFCDEDSFSRLYSNKQKLSKLQEREQYYLERIEEVKKDRKELLTNPELLEKYAREHYFMKKPTEDIFVVPDEKEEE